MADVKIDMMLADSSGSIGKRTNETKALNTELTKTQRLARSAAAGGSTSLVGGGDAVAMQGYNQARGAAGTGSAGRDFANQAQGLGGLVRVYATFAANLYAVGAAFTALKNAADTTNLLKGLEQLGVASGVNLPKVAKDLVEASGGAISLRDAMTATAQASSAGMTSQNIKRMGEVARNASQAMGIDMTNALDRLSRGITKLEPELLDELGIFTRTEQASQDYARALGKSVSSLTSFEKRQAFANAVLAEGEQKFGAIALQTNPYNQLLASLKNLSQAGLELINTVLGPIIKFLSQSPVALGAAIAAIAATLIKQAIPALTQWREQLAENVERTSAAAAQNLQYFKNYQQDIARTAAQGVSEAVKTQADIAKTSWEGLQQQTRQSILRNNKELRNIMKTDLESASQDQMQGLARVRQQYERAAGASYSDPARQQAAQARLAEFNKVEPEIRKAISAQLDYNRALDAATPTSLSIQGKLLQRIADNADIAEKKMRILANAADNAAFSGPIAAMTAMSRAIQRLPDSVGLAAKGMLYLRGTLTITAVAVGTLTTAFGNLLGVIGIISGVGMLLGTILSKNGDEAAKSSKSIDDLKSAGDNLDRVLESISKKSPLQQLSSDSIAASATAMGDLGKAINQAIKDTDATIAARGWWDSFTNGLASVIGKSDEQTLEKTVTKQLNKILKASTSSLDAANIRKDLTKALGLGEGASEKDILKAFTTDIKTAGPELQKLLDKFQMSAQSGKAFSDTLKELSKTFKDMTNELMPKGKIIDAIDQSTIAYSDLSKLLDGPVTVSLSSINALLKNTQALSLIPPNSLKDILQILPAIDAVSNRIADNQVTINSSTIALEKYNNELETMRGLAISAPSKLVAGEDGKAVMAKDRAEYLQEISQKTKEALGRAQREIASDSLLVDTYKETFRKAVDAGFRSNSDLLTQIFALGIQKARIQAEQGALSNLPVTPDVINRQAELQKKQIDIDIQGQVIQNKLILSNEKLSATMDLLRLESEKANVLATESNAEIRKGLIADIDKRRAPVAARISAITEVERGYVSAADLQKRNQGLTKEDAMGLSKMSGAAGQLRSTAEIQKAAIDLDATLKKIDFDFSTRMRALDQQSSEVDNKLKLLEADTINLTANERAILELRKQLEDIKLERQNLEVGRQVVRASSAAASTGLGSQAVERSLQQPQLGIAGAAATTTTAKTVLDTSYQIKTTQEEVSRYYEGISAQMQVQAELSNQLNTRKSQELDYTSQVLQIARDRGTISEQDYQDQQKLLQAKKIELDFEKTLAEIERERARKQLEINRDIDLQSGGAGWEALTGRQQADILAREAALKQTTSGAIENAKRLRSESMSILDLQNSLSVEQQGLAEIYKNTFSGMSDAIVEFVRTGKLNFKSLITDMLAQIAKLYMNRMFMSLFSSLLPGLPGMGGSMGLGGPGGGTASLTGEQFALLKSAKGTAWDSGVHKFAMGGTFTNSIVDSPTLFKFAKGTGLMGEAGPEAIMPLKRDSQGNLGVRSNQGKVEVVVNNYSTAQAQTKETTDSRGNRRIEVVVGDMTAGEISRNGSSTQRAMGGTFGLQPQLIRR